MPLDSGAAILCHLRMTGRLHAEPRGWDAGKFWKVRLELDSGRDLVFIDVRKFGRFELVRDPAQRLAELGPEPLGPEFTAETLHAGLGARSRALKPLLLDQSFLAGLGNIYVDESLFRARLHPLANSRRVSAEQATLLHHEIRAVLSRGDRARGLELRHLLPHARGQSGQFPAPVPRLRPRWRALPRVRDDDRALRRRPAWHAHLPPLPAAPAPRPQALSSYVAETGPLPRSREGAVPWGRLPQGGPARAAASRTSAAPPWAERLVHA
jgi:hypothetical protein